MKETDQVLLTPANYRISERYAAATSDEQQLFMVSEGSTTIIRSKVAIKLLEDIQERSLTQEDIIQKATNYGTISEVVHTLYQLEKEGYITKETLCLPPDQSAYWSTRGYEPERIATVLLEKTVACRTIANAGMDELMYACQQAGIRQSASPDLTLVVTPDYLAPAIKDISREMFEKKQPWLLIKLGGQEPLIGPLFSNQETSACYTCLEHRLLLHDQQNTLYKTQNKSNASLPHPTIGHPLTRQIAANQVLLQVLDYFYTGDQSKFINTMKSIDPITGCHTNHQLVKRPQCTTCGDADLLRKMPQSIEVNHEHDTMSKLGGYRIKSHEETLELFQHHVSPITGIMPHLKTYNSLSGAPIFNYISGKNLALQSKSMFWLNMHLRSANGGKGINDLQAKTGALCESIERYSIMYHGETYSVTSSYEELQDAIHPNELMLFSDSQYTEREEINRKSGKFYSLTPRTFDTNRVRNWTPVYSLTHQKFKYLPAVFCYSQYPDGDEKQLESYPDTNGCAAGNSLEEAMLQAYLELIERDAAAIWWYNSIERPAVALENAANPYIDKALAYYKSIGRSLHVLDITTDLNVPVFAAISYDLATESQILYAFGAHLSAKIALERAVVELNQLLPVVAKNPENYLTTDQLFVDWLDQANLQKETYLKPSDQLPAKSLKEYVLPCEETITAALQYCMQQTEKQGMETLVLDCTQPDVGMPVVKLMVPGLRHFWRRTAPGRLYDVPVKMGWKTEKNTEATLNSWSIFI